MPSSNASLVAGFLRSVASFPDRPALEVKGDRWSYEALHARASRLAGTLASPTGLTAVLAHRSGTAFSGILASLLTGGGYVPLNPNFPSARTREMLLRSGARNVIVDASGEGRLDEVLSGLPHTLRLVLPDNPDVSTLAERWPEHTFVGADGLAEGSSAVAGKAEPEGVAYLLFTSGSTGNPKGVAISHRSVRHFIDVVADRYGIEEGDRLTQMFDLTFDLSVFDMFVAWERGACVCCPSPEEKAMPARFIQESGVTVWFSVPSTAFQMKRLRMLKENQYPQLRWSLFCGEALTADLADAFGRAAPNSIVENLYGPTEATIACTVYRWDPETSPSEVEHDIVPIGSPLAGLEARVVGPELAEVAPGEAGELLIGGPQVAIGYWNDPERTSAAFVRLPGAPGRFYRTGDLARRPATPDEPLKYLGRIDHQIKIHGYRVELGEIESAVRDEAGVDVAVAVGWPRTAAGATGIVVFVERPGDDALSQLGGRLKERLPTYMVPQRVIPVDDFPLNANGKVDRGALVGRYLQPAGSPSDVS